MGLDIDQACRPELAQLFPGQRVRGVRHRRWIDEERHRNAVATEHGQHVAVDRSVSVVDGEDDGATWRRACAAQVRHQDPQRDQRITLPLQRFELALKDRGAHCHVVGRGGPEAVVDEDRNGDIRAPPGTPREQGDGDGRKDGWRESSSGHSASVFEHDCRHRRLPTLAAFLAQATSRIPSHAGPPFSCGVIGSCLDQAAV